MVRRLLSPGGHRSPHLALVIPLLAILALGLGPAAAAQADTWTVCASGCDFATIQAAIDDAGIRAGDVIHVSDAVHTEQGITVTKDVTIQGEGPGRTIVQAGETSESATERVFLIGGGATATIKDLTIRHGHPSECPLSGGGITNQGTLTLENVVVRDNVAKSGGGIVNEGTLTLIRCTVRDNVAEGAGNKRGSGGGIKNVMGALTIVDSTISGNDAFGKGGGIKHGCSSTLEMVNSTVSGNRCNQEGGGIHVRGIATLTHTTISDNSARSGGGLYILGTSDHKLGILDFSNTIIAGNTKGGDCVIGDEGTIRTNANNLVGDGGCSPALSGDAGLAGLADNGGRTLTHALLPGSPAIDALAAADCPPTADQRGEPRPVGYASEARCDIGAFELQREETASVSELETGAARTFGATMVRITRAEGSGDLGALTVTKEIAHPGPTCDSGEISVTWHISASDESGFGGVEIELGYADAEIAGLDEASLRAFRREEGWGTARGAVDLDRNCVTVSDVSGSGTWTLFDTSKDSGDGNRPNAGAAQGWDVPWAWGAAVLGALAVIGGGLALAWRRRRARR